MQTNIFNIICLNSNSVPEAVLQGNKFIALDLPAQSDSLNPSF